MQKQLKYTITKVSIVSIIVYKKKSHIWETPNLLTDADSRTDTILKNCASIFSKKTKQKKLRGGEKKWGG